MTFEPSVVSLGEGRLSSAAVMGGELRAVLSSGGRLILKRYDLSTRAVRPGRTLSYAFDCAECDGGLVERRGQLYYVPLS